MSLYIHISVSAYDRNAYICDMSEYVHRSDYAPSLFSVLCSLSVGATNLLTSCTVSPCIQYHFHLRRTPYPPHSALHPPHLALHPLHFKPHSLRPALYPPHPALHPAAFHILSQRGQGCRICDTDTAGTEPWCLLLLFQH